MSYHDLPQAILTHLAFTLVSVLFGLILGVVLGILLSRRPKLSKFVLPVLSALLLRELGRGERVQKRLWTLLLACMLAAISFNPTGL